MRSPERPSAWVIAAALSLLLGLQPLTTDLYLPALPLIQRDLAAPMSGVQLTMSALILSFGCAQLVWGPVADRFGRRPVLLLSLGLYVAASIACAWAPRIEWLVATRVAQGAMMAAAVVVGRAMVRDLFEPHEGAQVMSRGMTGLAVIAVVSMPAGGFLTEHFGWPSTLLTTAAVGALTWVFVYARLPETLPAGRHLKLDFRLLAQRAATILSSRVFQAWALLVTSTYAGLFVVLSTSSFVYTGALGLTPLQYGLALSSNSLSYLFGTVCCRRWIAAIGLTGTVRRGAAFTATGSGALVLVGIADAPSLWAVLAAQWLYAFGHGIHQPCGQTGAVGPFPHMAGTASALAGFILALAAFGVGLVLGAAFDGSVRFMAWGAALGGTLTAMTAWTLVQRHGSHHPT